jgi:hypothetical protein
MNKILISTAVALLSLGLSGCFQNPIEAAVENVTEQAVENALEQEGIDADIDLGGGSDVSIPEGWPASVPIPDGNVFSAITVDDMRTITMEVASEAVGLAGLEAIKAEGFSVVFEQNVEGMITAALEGNGLSVIYAMATDQDTTTVTISVGPSEAAN